MQVIHIFAELVEQPPVFISLENISCRMAFKLHFSCQRDSEEWLEIIIRVDRPFGFYSMEHVFEYLFNYKQIEINHSVHSEGLPFNFNDSYLVQWNGDDLTQEFKNILESKKYDVSKLLENGK